MKKTTKSLIAAALTVVVLGVGLAVVINLPSDEISQENKTNNNSSILLYDKSSCIAEEITINNSGGEYKLLGFDYSVFDKSSESYESAKSSDSVSQQSQESSKTSSSEDTTVLYTMQDSPDIDLSKNMTDDLSHQCKSLTALSVIDKSGNKFRDYGLDNPRSEVSIVFSDGSAEKFSLGNDAPDNQGVYMRFGSGKNVYLVPSSTVSAFLVEKLQMYDKTITPSVSTTEGIVSLDISGNYYESPINIYTKENNTSLVKFSMSSPNREICNEDTVETAAHGVYGLSGTKVEAVVENSDILKEYGLYEPYVDIKVTAENGVSAEVIVSKENEDGLCYIMKKDGMLIFSVDKSYIESWYEIDYNSLLRKNVISPNILTLSKMAVSFDNKSYNYNINHKDEVNPDYEDIISSTANIDGKEIDYSNLIIYIANLSAAERQNEIPKNLDSTERLLRTEFYFSGQDEYTDVLEIYKTKDDKRIIVLNSKIECYTDKEYIDKVISQTDSVSGKETLELFNEEFYEFEDIIENSKENSDSSEES